MLLEDKYIKQGEKKKKKGLKLKDQNWSSASLGKKKKKEKEGTGELLEWSPIGEGIKIVLRWCLGKLLKGIAYQNRGI